MIEKFIHFQKGQKKMANLWQMSSFINALNVTSEMVKPLFLQFYYLFILFTYTLIFTTIWSTNMLSMFMCWFWTVILGVCAQVRGNSDGGVGSVVDGVSFPEYQAVCGELFTHGSQTAGIQRTWFASAGHQLCKFVWVWLNKPANAILNLCRRSEVQVEDEKWLWLSLSLSLSLSHSLSHSHSHYSLTLTLTLTLLTLSPHSILCCIIPGLGFSNMFPVYLKHCKYSSALNCLEVFNIASSIEAIIYLLLFNILVKAGHLEIIMVLTFWVY